MVDILNTFLLIVLLYDLIEALFTILSSGQQMQHQLAAGEVNSYQARIWKQSTLVLEYLQGVQSPLFNSCAQDAQ